jgi:hypothetical protein
LKNDKTDGHLRPKNFHPYSYARLAHGISVHRGAHFPAARCEELDRSASPAKKSEARCKIVDAASPVVPWRKVQRVPFRSDRGLAGFAPAKNKGRPEAAVFKQSPKSG